MYTGNDRMKQVNWLREVAGDIRLYGNGYGTPAEQVSYWEGEGHNLPPWYDQHDHNFLVEMVSD